MIPAAPSPIAASDINNELSVPWNSTLSLNTPRVRAIAEQATNDTVLANGTQIAFSELRGKSKDKIKSIYVPINLNKCSQRQTALSNQRPWVSVTNNGNTWYNYTNSYDYGTGGGWNSWSLDIGFDAETWSHNVAPYFLGSGVRLSFYIRCAYLSGFMTLNSKLACVPAIGVSGPNGSPPQEGSAPNITSNADDIILTNFVSAQVDNSTTSGAFIVSGTQGTTTDTLLGLTWYHQTVKFTQTFAEWSSGSATSAWDLTKVNNNNHFISLIGEFYRDTQLYYNIASYNYNNDPDISYDYPQFYVFGATDAAPFSYMKVEYTL